MAFANTACESAVGIAMPIFMFIAMSPPPAMGLVVLSVFAENAEPKASKAHMGMFVVTYHNDVVTAAIGAHTLPLPDGAIIVKENKMKADEPVHALTIMSKQGGKWYWLETSPDGSHVITMNDMPQEGYNAQMCAKCHDDASYNDFVFTHSFAK